MAMSANETMCCRDSARLTAARTESKEEMETHKHGYGEHVESKSRDKHHDDRLRILVKFYYCT